MKYLGYGPSVKEFEERYAQYSGYKYNVGVNSASAAAFIIFQYFKHNLHVYKTVYTPTVGFTSPAWAAMHAGLQLRFTDVDYNLMMIPPTSIDLPDCIFMPVLYGGVSKTNFPPEILKRSIVDSAHCVSPTEKAFAHFFSFFCTKPIRMINGGMISTDDSELAYFARRYRNFGRMPDYKQGYQIDHPGFRFYMDQPNAEMGLNELPLLRGQRELRKAYSIIYQTQLKEFGRFTVHDDSSSHYLCTMLAKKDVIELRKKIGSSLHYPLLHQQQFYYNGQSLSHAEAFRDNILNLPIHHSLQLDEILKNIEVVREYFSNS